MDEIDKSDDSGNAPRDYCRRATVEPSTHWKRVNGWKNGWKIVSAWPCTASLKLS